MNKTHSLKTVPSKIACHKLHMFIFTIACQPTLGQPGTCIKRTIYTNRQGEKLYEKINFANALHMSILASAY